MDVGGWLRKFGLGQYEANFRDNKIDVDVLADLTDGDLERLGLPLGDRKRLMKAIAALPAALAKSGTMEARAAPAASAERRQVNVMFCDLVDSTVLSRQLDPEDYRDLIRAYQDACAGAIARFDGFVAKFMGDGLLAYFGWPRAHEDDAERAINAGLDIISVLRGMTAPPRRVARGARRHRHRASGRGRHHRRGRFARGGDCRRGAESGGPAADYRGAKRDCHIRRDVRAGGWPV